MSWKPEYREFENDVRAAEDAFDADGMTCPRCGRGTLRSSCGPDEEYCGDDFMRTETFRCSECGIDVEVTDTYVIDKSRRRIEYIE